MRYILDLVHHNPGETPFSSRFLDPAHLAEYGFTGQVCKHLNCVATFAATGCDCFPTGSPDRDWLDRFTAGIVQEISAAKARGLAIYYHIDLFVLPRLLVEHFRAEICDPHTGRIQLDRPRTLELHRVLFDELVARFPQVDGFIIRVGETYLFDTPYHQGNGPIPRVGPPWTPDYLYPETLADQVPADPRWTEAQVAAYVDLLRFLRAEVCVKHGRRLFFRTWDIFPDKLHARLDHYIAVTDQVEPHPHLVFSIKHTALDFWRRVKVNECLTRGRHPQIVEVQCQREYEGKGAFPNYVMAGVIDGFEENERRIGLKDLLADPRIVGVFSWSRGGGWYGPYLQHELWPDLNAYVLAQFVRNPIQSEKEIFMRYAREKLGLTPSDSSRFRELSLLSARAILLGRYCAAFDGELRETVLPVANWMRDDRLGGRNQLHWVFHNLHVRGRLKEALTEKAEAVRLWREIEGLANRICWADERSVAGVRVSAAYGRLLFTIVHQGWRVLAAGAIGDATGRYDRREITDAAARYAEAWRDYRALATSPHCASLYHGTYFALPGQPPEPGLDDSVAHYQRVVQLAE